jgi:uncharacterized protein YybS (DUF2232 family)
VVEGTGLIIRFPMEHHWFEPSRMQSRQIKKVKFKDLINFFKFFIIKFICISTIWKTVKVSIKQIINLLKRY